MDMNYYHIWFIGLLVIILGFIGMYYSFVLASNYGANINYDLGVGGNMQTYIKMISWVFRILLLFMVIWSIWNFIRVAKEIKLKKQQDDGWDNGQPENY